MAEIETPIVTCIERIYELIHDGKRLRIKSTKPISSDDNNRDVFSKEISELLKFIKEYEIEINPISFQSNKHSEQIPIESPKEETKEEVPPILPNDEEVIRYITSKDLFRHDTIELQEKFLGKRLQVRDDRTLFNSFDNILRRARKHIAKNYNIEWDSRERKSYSNRSHVILYKIKKANEEQKSNLNSILQTELQPLVGDYKKEEQLNNIIT